MLPFHHRFKLKTSVIGKDGFISIQNGHAVTKPLENQIHSPVIRAIAKKIMTPNDSPSKLTHTPHPLSVPPSPMRPNPSDDSPFSSSPCKKLETVVKQFKPYTIQDYYSIKPEQYYQLGGLGANCIGTDDWNRKKLKSQRRKIYGIAALKSHDPRNLINFHVRSMSSSL